MKTIQIVTLIIILTVFHIAQSYKGCPHGWYLSDDEMTCYVKCFTSQLFYSNVYCNFIALKSVNVSYDSSKNVLSIPSGDTMGSFNVSSIPPCYNVTLQRDQYSVTSDGYIQIASYLMEIPLKYVTKMTSTNITLRYPSSPQLFQCNVSSALPGSYEIVDGTMLFVYDRNLTAFLGDFYVNDKAIAFFCPQNSPNVSFTIIPRCNMAVLPHTDYLINGDSSMSVLSANVTIQNPLHSINYSQHAIVCFPLSFDYLNCPLRENVAQNRYTIYPNLTLLDMFYRSLLDPFDYYVTIDSQLVTCVDSNMLSSAPIVMQKIYNYFYLLSSLALLLTIVLKFRKFAQNYHNRCLLCHIVSLAIMFFSLGMQLFYAKVEVVSCYVLFVADYYFNMAAFFWLNVIAFDSWQFFSRIQTVEPSCLQCGGRLCCAFPCLNESENRAVRFAIYNAYSWGLAAVLTATILYLDLYVSPYDFRYQVRPFVLPSCSLATSNSFFMFEYLPLTATTVTNLILLGLTVRILHRASAGTEAVNVRRRRQVFNISLKLFILMSLCWTVDCLTIGFGIIDTSVFQMWFLGLGVTSLQGISIFGIYCAPKLCT